MSEWKETKLGEYAKVLGGYAFKSQDFQDFGDYPVIKIKNVASGKLDMSECQYISNKTAEQAIRFKAEKNDILIAMTGSHITQPSSMVGRAARYNSIIEAYINQRVGKIVSRDERSLNADFLYYFMVQEDTTYSLANIASGSANQANISAGQIEDLPLLLPSEKEQRAIAGVLSSLDDKIGLLTRQNATLEALAQTYFRHWFVENGSNNWETGKIEDYFEIGIGKTPPRQEQEWFTDNPNDKVWVSIADMGKSGLFIGDSSEYLTDEAVERFNIRRIPKGSVLLSFKLTVGRVAITLCEMTTNEAIAHFKCKDEKQREYLYCYLKVFDYYSLGSTSSIATAVNSKIIKAMPFVMPDIMTLTKFHKLTLPLFRKMEVNTKQILTLQKLRDTLLPKLIIGEVRINSEAIK